MKIEDVRRKILSEWKSFPKDEKSTIWSQQYKFYTWLERERSKLLAFNCSGDKWQRIKTWIS